MSTDYDVVVVGAGPVGLAVAGFLGRYRWKVGVFDQETSMYPLPRAGHVDSEIMRLLQILGCAHEFVDKAVPLREGVFINAEGEVLTRLPLLVGGSTGWHSDYLLYQPDFDDALRSVVDDLASVDIHRGQKLVRLEQAASGVTAGFRAQPEGGEDAAVNARYLIGADGANSFVRRAIESPWIDLGFEERWLVVDIKPHEADAERICPDPDRSATRRGPPLCSGGLAASTCVWSSCCMPVRARRSATMRTHVGRWPKNGGSTATIRRSFAARSTPSGPASPSAGPTAKCSWQVTRRI